MDDKIHMNLALSGECFMKKKAICCHVAKLLVRNSSRKQPLKDDLQATTPEILEQL